MNLLLPALLVGGGLYVMNLKKQGDALTKCEIHKFKLGTLKIGLQEITIPVVLDIYNPNSTTVYVDYFRGNVYRAGIKAGDFTFTPSAGSTGIKGRATTQVTFNVRIGTIGAVRQIIDIFKNLAATKPIDSVFKIEGVIQVSGFTTTINKTWDVKNGKEVNAISGIGKPYVKMEFGSNDEMKKYFESGCKNKLPPFSVNGF